MRPYYHDAASGITIYCGDAREVLPELNATVVITDPVWLNSTAPIIGIDRPKELLSEIISACPNSIARAAFQIGCDTDPALLAPASLRWPFFRAAWLEYARPHYKGRLLYGSDVAYLYGTPPASADGKRVIPGRCFDISSDGKQSDHPCPRKISHVAWLVRWWSESTDMIVDPQMGSGTTLRAAKDAGIPAIGIEIEERFCAMAVERLRQEVLFGAEVPA